jgi:hypothetical protein
MLESLASDAVKLVTDSLLGKWKKHDEAREKVELYRRRIRSTRIANGIYRELHGFREVFLEHNLADKYDANRRFFEKWLTDPIVEMGWTPAGGWTRERITELLRDLEGVSA